MSLAPAVIRRIMRELGELQSSPPEGIRIAMSEGNMLDVTGIIQGPVGTPYEGGYFHVKFKFTEAFPASPPKCWLATKIFHPNVSTAGEICVNTLKKDWQSTFGIAHILTTVKCLLIYPNPDSALDEEAGRLLQENYEGYCERARIVTSVHATPRVRPKEFDVVSEGEDASSSKVEATEGPVAALRASPKVALGTADSNVGAGVPAVEDAKDAPKAVKRAAAPTAGAEKRKKALKRL